MCLAPEPNGGLIFMETGKSGGPPRRMVPGKAGVLPGGWYLESWALELLGLRDRTGGHGPD